MSVVLRPPSDIRSLPRHEMASGKGADPLVLDLSGVEMLTAAGLTELLELHHRLRSMDGELVLVNVSEQVLEVFEVARLTHLFHLRPKAAATLMRS